MGCIQSDEELIEEHIYIRQLYKYNHPDSTKKAGRLVRALSIKVQEVRDDTLSAGILLMYVGHLEHVEGDSIGAMYTFMQAMPHLRNLRPEVQAKHLLFHVDMMKYFILNQGNERLARDAIRSLEAARREAFRAKSRDLLRAVWEMEQVLFPKLMKLLEEMEQERLKTKPILFLLPVAGILLGFLLRGRISRFLPSRHKSIK